MAPTLYDILSNPILLHLTAPYLSISSICALIRTDRSLRSLLINNGSLYRFLDLQETPSQMMRWASRNRFGHSVNGYPPPAIRPMPTIGNEPFEQKVDPFYATTFDNSLGDGKNDRVAIYLLIYFFVADYFFCDRF